jgi:hypothetical protein
MNRIDNRPRGVLGYTLDTGILKDAIIDALWARDLYKSSTREDLLDRIEPMTTVICYNDNAGEWALINTEGVGRYAKPDGKSSIHFWIDTYHEGDAEVDLPTIDGCINGGEVDLADFIRVFGDRLDNNHQTWFNWANYNPQPGHYSVTAFKAKQAHKLLNI